MKTITAVALFVAVTFAAAGSARAQDGLVNANVPFNFTVGDHALPSGTYAIRSSMPTPGALVLRNWDKKVTVISLGEPTLGNSGYGNTLVFHKYGDQYFLSDIRSMGTSVNVHFAPTKAEKQAKAQAVEAGLFVNDPVLIALK
jgi:hypothetical protein